MRGTYGSPLRLVTTLVTLTAELQEEIENRRFKHLIPEKLEKLLEILGEGLEVHGVRLIVGEGSEELGSSEVRMVHLISGFLLKATGYFSFATASALEEPAGTEANNYKAAHIGNFFAVFPAAKPANFTFTGWSNKLKDGVTEVAQGQPLMIFNSATAKRTITLINESAASEPANHFQLLGPEIVLAPHQAALFVYQGSRWHLVTAGTITTTPTPSAVEKTIVAGAPGLLRKRVFALTGDALKTEWVLKHELETFAVVGSVQTESAKKPSEVVLTEKFIATSENEVTVTFNKPPGAGVVFFATVIG